LIIRSKAISIQWKSIIDPETDGISLARLIVRPALPYWPIQCSNKVIWYRWLGVAREKKTGQFYEQRFLEEE